MFDKVKSITNIHFIGIGGSGMSGIAEVLLNFGYKISGSDIKESDILKRLEDLGVNIHYKHDTSNVNKVDLVVVSTAITKNNPELKAAKELNIPIISRGEMLAELMRLKSSIAIAGTHGKTTSTSILSWIMTSAGLDPTIVIGGRLNNLGTGAKLGKGDFIVAEADESDGSFLKLNPIISVVTNIDNDHMDYYKNMNELKKSFVKFINKVPFYGWTVLCNDNENIREILPKINRKYFTYGIENKSDVMAKNIRNDSKYTIFDLYYDKEFVGVISMPLIGVHNVYNTLASILVAKELDIKFTTIKKALKNFKGVGRRLEIKGQKKDILVVDDYGHHPREIEATWKSVKSFWKDRDIYVLFQPHRYSRTKMLAREFADIISSMDNVLLLPIYAAGEKPINGVTSKVILDNMISKNKSNVVLIEDNDNVIDYLLDNVCKNSLVLTLGAGNVVGIGEEFLKRL